MSSLPLGKLSALIACGRLTTEITGAVAVTAETSGEGEKSGHPPGDKGFGVPCIAVLRAVTRHFDLSAPVGT